MCVECGHKEDTEQIFNFFVKLRNVNVEEKLMFHGFCYSLALRISFEIVPTRSRVENIIRSINGEMNLFSIFFSFIDCSNTFLINSNHVEMLCKYKTLGRSAN